MRKSNVELRKMDFSEFCGVLRNIDTSQLAIWHRAVLHNFLFIYSQYSLTLCIWFSISSVLQLYKIYAQMCIKYMLSVNTPSTSRYSPTYFLYITPPPTLLFLLPNSSIATNTCYTMFPHVRGKPVWWIIPRRSYIQQLILIFGPFISINLC